MRFTPCFILALSIISGCGAADNSPKTYKLQGAVTLDGEPIPTATILLVDPSGQLRTSVAKVFNGVLSGESTAGEKQLEVTAYRIAVGKRIPGADGTGSESATEQYLPEKYNTATTLTTTIEAKENATLNLELKRK